MASNESPESFVRFMADRHRSAMGGPPRPGAPPTADHPPPRRRAPRDDAAECRDLETAATRALNVYPGPVGELLYREIQAYAQLGRRFAAQGVLLRVIDELLQTPPGR